MAVSERSHVRDGDVCKVTFLATNNGNATTADDVIGHVTQFAFNQSAGTDAMSVTLNDTSTGMELFTGGSVSDDINAKDFYNGGGGYCRGPLKLTISGHAGAISTDIIVYYTKL